MKRNLLVITLIIIIISSCKKDEKVTKHEGGVTGFVQKGPFSIGSSISLQELLPSLTPTGRIFESQVEDNRGTFHIPNISLVSSIVSLRADGFYFNEVSGSQSASQITLNCLSDISNKSTININLISHLEKPRVEYLISQGVSFAAAKKQAEQEILQIFNINKPNLPESELLDITHYSDDNAVLLAVSLILQGYRTEGELSNLLASISYDIRQDGVLTNSSLGSALINDAKHLKLDSIRQNISLRWNALGINDSIPNFEGYLSNFINSTSYVFTNYITYPTSGAYGLNLLNLIDSIYIGNGQLLSIDAFLPKGATLRVEGLYNIGLGTQNGWNLVFPSQSEIVLASNKSGHITMWTSISTNFSIKFYENGATVPTRIKNIYVQ